ncbi:tannase/feruloyl esterase family alpha/beta hydrolase [Tenggerimyces flavus]|uniref:Tannase/feruloyl esterase family alpha/beta hydrolase n=1 Tax=Tenggerimyces flavus TaxID=1708749 RepID=A0ABV7YGL5_9ACTN|nr:tannase/feruloyl esterase family alpha/beta hydrolase [Tenggerimyces flavus]MBM7786843.1 feruloyl esterase [Tenggerimyces flavus]
MTRSTLGRAIAAVAVIVAAVGGLLSAPAVASGGTVPPVVRCADLVRSYPGVSTVVTAATEVSANGTTYCAVTGRVAPAVDFQLKLPLSTYTGRYVQYGCDGLCGLIRDVAIPNCGTPGRDLVVGATNDGHTSPLPGQELFDGRWAADDQAARNDYFYRAPHVVARAAKRIIATFYGRAPKYSYFNGCSTGGREALLLAQRYPHDFDGIIAGAPVNYMGPLFGVYMPWIIKANRNSAGQPILTIDKLPALNAAVLAACDGLDGLVDGQLEDPRACTYDPALLRCPAGTDLPSCLTPAQVTTARKLYAGPTDALGSRLYPGWQTRGSELAWVYSVVPGPNGEDFLSALPDNYLRYVGYPIGRPHSSLASVAFTQSALHKLTPEGVKGNALALDLSEFRRAGGKLILWHGWNDHAIPAVGTLNYYDRVVARNGGLTATQRWMRTFMVPAKPHCEVPGGPSFDPLPALLDWVDEGNAPRKIVATSFDQQGNVARTRPVFPYPLRARYDGSGSIDEASNFVPAPPMRPTHDRIDWAGSYLHAIPGPIAR